MKLYSYFLIVCVVIFSGCGGGGGGSTSSDTSDTTSSDTTSSDTTVVASLDLIQFNSEHFAGSGDCAACHSQLTDAGGNDVSMDSDWRSTMMANAARDPFWQAKLASETIRHPALKSVIEEKCSHCHTPMAERQSMFDSGNIDNTKLLDDGFLNPENDYHTMGMDGVSCSLCHQIQDTADLGTKDSFTGHFTIDEVTTKPSRLIYGPYLDVFTNLMRAETGYTPTYSAHIESSKLCATCHMLYTPTIGDNGDIVGEIAEQAAYLEWQHSGFADGGGDDKSCQECHMPTADGEVKISNRPTGNQLTKKSPFYKHHFVGGNAYMVNLIKEHASEIGVTAEQSHFDETISRTIAQLQNDTAELSIGTIVPAAGQFIDIPVTVTNLTGHKLPTGFPSRRAWIHLRVSAADGTVIFESGAVDTEGKINGCDADDDLESFEPHYDLIDSNTKVQIYESIMADVNGQPTYTLLRGASYIKDNRLLPRGFDKNTAVDDVGVFGAAKVDSDFIGGGDKITYSVNTAGHTGELTIEAVLNFQTISYSFYTDLSEDSDVEPLVKRFKDFYEATDTYKSGIAISTDSKTYTK
jgi:hypothetical protein